MTRTVFILPMFVLCALAIVIVYPLLGLGGPRERVEQARQAMEREEYTEALRLLDLVKHDADPNDSILQEKIRRMRARTYEQLGDRKNAISDLDYLLDSLQIQTHELAWDRIRLHNEIGEIDSDVEALERALRHCKRWLTTNRDDVVVMGLAGRSRQILARIEIAEWVRSFASQLPLQRRRAILALLDRAIFSTQYDQRITSEIVTQTREIDAFVPGFSESFHPQVDRIRKTAESAREWFLKALKSERSDRIAYEGLAEQLRAAHEDDTLLQIAHIHLARAPVRDGFTAAVDIAEVHLSRDRYRAARELCLRILPPDDIQKRYRDGTLNFAALRLLACYAVAVHKLGLKKEGMTMMYAVGKIAFRTREAPEENVEDPPFGLTHFVLGMLKQRPREIAGNLSGFSRKMRNYPWFHENLSPIAFEKWVSVAPLGSKDSIYRQWAQSRPHDPKPVHEYARWLMSQERFEDANRLLLSTLAWDQTDVTLEMLVQAQERLANLDLDTIIKRADSLDRRVPLEIQSFPALAISAARRALETKFTEVAMGCAERSRARYPRFKIPHYLHAKALLAQGDPQSAAQVLTLMLEEHPNDEEGIKLLALARQAEGLPTDDLRFSVILRGTPDLESTRFLARRWLARGDYQRVLTLAQSATSEYGVDVEMQVLATRALMLDPEADRKRVLTMLRAVYHLSQAIEDPTPEQRELSWWALGQYVLHNPTQLSEDIRGTLLDRFLGVNENPQHLEEIAAAFVLKRDYGLALRCYRDLCQDDRYKDYREGEHLVAAAQVAMRLDDTTKARELLAAALAFKDADRASLELALLDLAEDEEISLPDTLVIDSVLAASLVARVDGDRATPYLVAQLTANPDHFACQCIIAALDKQAECSKYVRAVAAKSGSLLLKVIALLQRPSFAPMAVRHAQQLVGDNDANPVAQLLLAHALGYADRPIEVQRVFNAIRRELPKDPLLMSAALEILGDTDHPALRLPKIREQMAAQALQRGVDAPPALLALVLRQNDAILTLPGVRETILPLVKGFWLKFPELSRAGLREVRMLIDLKGYEDALQLCKKIEKGLTPSQRSAWLTHYYDAANGYVRSRKPEASKPLISEAQQLLARGEVHGAPLHFLLRWLDRHLKTLSGTQAGDVLANELAEAERKYLQLHIDGCDPKSPAEMSQLLASLERIARRVGKADALASLDGVLQRDPSLIPVWRLRASWLIEMDRTEEATTSLLWLPRYLENPEVLDTLVQLLARSGSLVRRGKEILSMRTLATASKLTLGLSQLRVGNYLPASQTLARAKPQADGSHLYYHAVALIALQTVDSRNLAKSLLKKLVADYPDGPFLDSAATVLRVL